MARQKFTFAQLSLLNWLFDNGQSIRFLTKFIGGVDNHELEFHEVVERNGDGKYVDRVINNTASVSGETKTAEAGQRVIDLQRTLGGSFKIELTEIIRAGYIVQLTGFLDSERRKQFQEKFAHLPLTNTALIRPTTTGRAWYEAEGRALYEAQATKRADRRKASERTVLIWAEFDMGPDLSAELKAKVPEGVKLPLPRRKIMRPFATATVIGQTEKRILVEDVKLLEDWQQYGGLYSSYKIMWPIQGRSPNLFIEPGAVMVDHADEAIVEKLREIDVDDVESFNRTANYHMDKILPLLIEMNLGLKQSGLARDELINDAIEGFRSSSERKPR